MPPERTNDMVTVHPARRNALQGNYRRRTATCRCHWRWFRWVERRGGARKAPVRITVIDQRNHHLFQPLLYQVATAGLSPAEIAAPIRSIVRRMPRVTIMLGEAYEIDTTRRLVQFKDAAQRELAYDLLVVATGARHSYFGHDEWAALAPGLKTIGDATKAKRARDLRRIHPPSARIVLIEAGRRLLPAFAEDLSAYALRALQRLGVEVRLGAPVTSIEPGCVRVGEERLETHTVISDLECRRQTRNSGSRRRRIAMAASR